MTTISYLIVIGIIYTGDANISFCYLIVLCFQGANESNQIRDYRPRENQSIFTTVRTYLPELDERKEEEESPTLSELGLALRDDDEPVGCCCCCCN